MKVWIPEKSQIEDMLWTMSLHLGAAKTVSEVEKYLDDKLTELKCHIANRAMEERKRGA